ncbi:hypothetical protein [Rhodococcus sp. NCIMB 12038]|uniref:hypothetical protein n=1 Tax=Rhodococcus sp. NCIMB 12038 TaxID=933800 RepID=UPI000B3C19E6|nr:hypothetical protein [Rhodococcus sp. NCIMB 12038]OUS97649.1 hypothetical protein CA951_01080 [Rhodococcus sp. NCIMB 12038]
MDDTNTHGLGLSVGTACAVAAVAGAVGVDAVLTRRSTLTFGPLSTVRLGDPPGDTGVVAGFADRIGETVVAGDGLRYSGQDLVATAAHCLIAEAAPPDDTPIVLAHPAVHPARVVNAQRDALDRAGLGRVGLVASPVAAVAWLESEHGLLGEGLALVCEVGADNLDLTVVAFGAGSGSDPIVGRPLRSTEFGGRHLTGVGDDSIDDPVAGTLELVADCLRVARVNVTDLDVVIVTGAAATDPAVEKILSAALGTPVVCEPAPGHASACGAAVLAAATRFVTAATASDRSASVGRRALRVTAAATAAAAMIAVPWLARDMTSIREPGAGSSVTTHAFELIEQPEPPRIPAARTAPSSPALTAVAVPQALPVEAVTPAESISWVPRVASIHAHSPLIEPSVEFTGEAEPLPTESTYAPHISAVTPVVFVPSSAPVATSTPPDPTESTPAPTESTPAPTDAPDPTTSPLEPPLTDAPSEPAPDPDDPALPSSSSSESEQPTSSP